MGSRYRRCTHGIEPSHPFVEVLESAAASQFAPANAEFFQSGFDEGVRIGKGQWVIMLTRSMYQ